MFDKLMYTKLNLDELQLVVETFEHSAEWTNQSNSIKVPKVVGSTS